ncbi:MAG: hypothetical protein V5A88_05185 [Candidatus Thermoplasmatota archaeon]
MLKDEVVKEIASGLKLDICRVTHGGDLDPEILKRRKDSYFWPQPFMEKDIHRLTDLSLHLDGGEIGHRDRVYYDGENDESYLSNYVTKKDYHDFLRGRCRI